jgi:ATP-binding cassette subfamily B protein
MKRSSLAAIAMEFVRDYPWQFGMLFLLLVLEGLSAGLTVLLVIPLGDFILEPSLANPSQVTKKVLLFMQWCGWQPSFWLLGGLFILSHFVKGVMDVAVRYSILQLRYTVVRGLFGSALESFFRARWDFFGNAAHGELLNTFNRELGTVGDAMGNVASLFAQSVQLLIYLAVPLWIDASMTLTALGLAALFGLPFMLLHRVAYRLGKENTETANHAIGVLGETLGAAKLILGFGLQHTALQHYLRAYDRHVEATLKSQTMAQAVPRFFQPFAMLATVIAINFAIERQVPVPELGAVMWSFLSALPILVSLLNTNLNLSHFLPSYDQLIKLRNSADNLKEASGTRKFGGLERGLELRDVNFTYPGRVQTLEAVNLEIRRGQMVALVGESGSGKSTIIDIILGFQLPNSGKVLIDGVQLSDWQQNTFRARVGYVPQEPILFHASIRENLLWANQAASDEDLWVALRSANAEKFVLDLPAALETIVGDRGIRLSGGQRQRIALARALLRKPDFLILDEATSALDSESERLIQDAIDRVAKNTTILAIAHRLSTVKRADIVYVLKKGRVVEQGSFTDLAARPQSIFGAMLAQQLATQTQ